MKLFSLTAPSEIARLLSKGLSRRQVRRRVAKHLASNMHGRRFRSGVGGTSTTVPAQHRG